MLGEVNEATKQLGTAERAAKFNVAFGLLGITGASVLGRLSGNTKELHQALVDAEGAAESTAKKMDSGIGGTLRKMGSSIEGVMIAIGEAINNALSSVVDDLSAIASAFTKWVNVNKEVVVGIAGATAAIGVMGVALIGLAATLKVCMIAAATMGTVVATLRTTMVVFRAIGLGTATAYGIVTGSIGVYTSALVALNAMQSATGVTGAAVAVVMGAIATAKFLAATASAAVAAGMVAASTSGSVLTGVGVALQVAFAPLTAVFWAVVGAVGAAASSMLPFVAIGLAVGAVFAGFAATAVIAAAKAGLFADAWKYVKSTLSGIVSVAQETFGGVKDALASGQYMVAAKMLWAGVKRAFWMGVKEVIRIFRTLPSTMWNIITRFGTEFLNTLWNLFTSIPSLLMKALSGESLSEAISAIFASGDWLDGLSTDRIIDARNELAELRKEAQRVRDIREDSSAGEAGNAQSDGSGSPNPNGQDQSQIISPEASPAASSAIQTKMQSLENEIKELKLGADAADNARLAEQARENGQDEDSIAAEIAALDALRERRRMLEKEKEATQEASRAAVDLIRSRAEELSNSGMAPDELYKREVAEIKKHIQLGKLSGADGKEAIQRAGQDRDARKETRASEAAQIRDSIKTPLEKFNEEVKRIMSLVKTGDLTRSEAQSAISKKREALQGQVVNSDPAPDLGIARFGSGEAFETLNRTRDIVSGGFDGASQAPPWVNPMTEAAKQQVTAAAELPAKIAESMQVATSTAIDTRRLEEIASKQLLEQQKLPTLLQKIVSNTSPESGDDL